MAERFRLVFVFSTAVLAGTAIPLTAQQINTQTSLLAATSVSTDTHSADNAQVATQNTQRGDSAGALIQKAEQQFQRGKKFYQAKDADRARTEFDGAIDTMLEAAELVSDRQAFDKRLDEMVEAVHRYDLAGLGSAQPVEETSFEKAPLEDILELTFPVDPGLKTKVKGELSATVSQLPLTLNDTVLGYIHYFSGRGRKTMLAGLERAGRYRPLIQRILDEEGVPQELIHLAQAESGFLPRAVSRKAAVGMWQFVAWRGQQYGLLRSRYTDDRLDPEKATRAAARHLRDLYKEFGDWYLAIAAYNCGPGVVEKAVQRTGYADYWELRARRVLPAETTNYVPIILAMTIMVKNAGEYGLDNVSPEPPLQYDTVDVDAPTHLALVADLTDAPVSELLQLNPALLRGVAPEGYSLRVPKGTAGTLSASLQLVPSARRLSWRMHKVAPGETLATIGKRYGTHPASIAQANNMDANSPIEGDRLMIPAVYRGESVRVPQVSTRHNASKRSADRAASAKHAKAGTSARASKRAKKQPAILSHRASIATSSGGQ
jgi:membrane-bound lytic murein transglycosylase D